MLLFIPSMVFHFVLYMYLTLIILRIDYLNDFIFRINSLSRLWSFSIILS